MSMHRLHNEESAFWERMARELRAELERVRDILNKRDAELATERDVHEATQNRLALREGELRAVKAERDRLADALQSVLRVVPLSPSILRPDERAHYVSVLDKAREALRSIGR